MTILRILGIHTFQFSPLVGGAVILSTVIMDATSGPNSAWISVISIVVGIFVALTGMLYHNMESRLSKMEEDNLPRREFDIAHKAVQDQLSRIEGHLVNVDSRNTWKEK
jgi:hypothetical protein